MKNPRTKSVIHDQEVNEKIGDISSSDDKGFPTSTKKRKWLIEISDDSDKLSYTRDMRR